MTPQKEEHMTEEEWLACEDPARMLRATQGHSLVRADGTRIRSEGEISDRKLRLFACACARLPWPAGSELTARERWFIDQAESMADDDRLYSDQEEYQGFVQGISKTGLIVLVERNGQHAAREWVGFGGRDKPFQQQQAALLRDIAGNPFRSVFVVECRGSYLWKKDGSRVSIGEIGKVLLVDEKWITPTVLSLAQAAYDQRQPKGTLDPQRLAILADALEEAGCTEEECQRCDGGRKNAGVNREAFTRPPLTLKDLCCLCHGSGRLPHPLLVHLHSSGPHVRGCWALDLILGKE